MNRKIAFLACLSLIVISGMVSVVPVSLIRSINEQKLDFVFLLHANQANVPYGDVANDLCYHSVLETMLKHPSLHFPLHFSGSLLTDLAWFNETTLDLLRQGITTGQFEIIGSTYAQNVMYSQVDDYDNKIQIEKHKQVIKEILNVEPTGFWNPERCWNQERYVDLLTDGDYTYTFVEDHIIEDSIAVTGYNEYRVRKTSSGQDSLLIFNDDKSIMSFVDTIAFTTESSSSPSVVSAVDNLIDFLKDVYFQDLDDDYSVFYGQDMEAWGLWQAEGHPSDSVSNVIDRLDYMFERLEQESNWLNVVTPSEFLDSLPTDYEYELVPRIVDGTADWMENPSKDAGYVNWFDFSANDSRLNDYRFQFNLARERLKEIDQAILQQEDLGKNISIAERLMSYAKFVYAANQYEFGCIGCYFPWYYRTKASLLTAEAAHYALDPKLGTEVLSDDLDLDGSNELILRNQKTMFIFTGIGGRLINWYDIEKGEILLANDIPNTYATWTVNGLDYDSGTPLSYPVSTVTGNDLWGRTTKNYRLRVNSFRDEFKDSESQLIWLSRDRSVELDKNSVNFSMSFSDRTITKFFLLKDQSKSLEISYTVVNNENYGIKPMIGMSFSPGNEEILFHGKKVLNLQIFSSNNSHTLLTDNVLTGSRIKISISGEGVEGISEDDIDPIFAKGFTIEMDEIAPGESSHYSFTLESKEIETSDLPGDLPTTSSDQQTVTSFVFLPFFLSTIAIVLTRKMKK
ncbi:MAG: hypothetical protein ACXAEU_14295 [Candidatus Hodarchaeales archaeon]|jgi:hypothetical protein